MILKRLSQWNCGSWSWRFVRKKSSRTLKFRIFLWPRNGRLPSGAIVISKFKPEGPSRGVRSVAKSTAVFTSTAITRVAWLALTLSSSLDRSSILYVEAFGRNAIIYRQLASPRFTFGLLYSFSKFNASSREYTIYFSSFPFEIFWYSSVQWVGSYE